MWGLEPTPSQSIHLRSVRGLSVKRSRPFGRRRCADFLARELGRLRPDGRWVRVQHVEQRAVEVQDVHGNPDDLVDLIPGLYDGVWDQPLHLDQEIDVSVSVLEVEQGHDHPAFETISSNSHRTPAFWKERRFIQSSNRMVRRSMRRGNQLQGRMGTPPLSIIRLLRYLDKKSILCIDRYYD